MSEKKKLVIKIVSKKKRLNIGIALIIENKIKKD